MNELMDLLIGILVVIYGIVFYIVGRTNLLEKIIIKFNEKLENNNDPPEKH